MRRLLALSVLLTGLVGCTIPGFDAQPAAQLGDFSLGHNIVIAPNPHQGPGSREATSDELIEAVHGAIEDKLRAYDGDKLYNLGISVDGYSLAEAGVPVVLSPKSVLILHITVWDDAAQTKLNDEAYQMIVIEDLTAKSIFGSGYFSTGDQQLNALADKTALMLEEWLEENNAWFGVEADETAE